MYYRDFYHLLPCITIRHNNQANSRHAAQGCQLCCSWEMCHADGLVESDRAANARPATFKPALFQSTADLLSSETHRLVLLATF
jgi:hypothetical protein